MIIYFINPVQPTNDQEIKKEDIKTEQSQDSKNRIPLKLFGEIESIKLNDTINIISDIFPNNSSSNKNQVPEEQTQNNQNTEPQEQSIDYVNNELTSLSLNDILAEVEKMSAEMLLELENPETCKTCGNSDENNEWLEKELLRMEYSTWEEYFSSENYKLGMEYYLRNKDALWNEEDSASLCATVFLAASGGGGGCSCDNAMGPCYTDTAYGRIYHCGGACCCACCSVCCK
ncbi:MAG: hypothetical protein KKC53_06790 [Actinobacteria bacterium]|nr:hypothetical protein [Actinomycetota bacterium]